MIMRGWRLSLSKTGGVAWLVLLLTACAGVGGTRPLPTPEPTVVSDEDRPEDPESSSTRIPADKYADLEIVTLLPRDAIPAIDDPQFFSAEEADAFYDPNELILGVTFDGDTRAYSVPFLSSHEIVNDTVGGVKIAVTW